MLLVWLISTGLVLFASVVSWNEGYINALIATHQSWICVVIALLCLFGAGPCPAMRLARELDLAVEAETLARASPGACFRVGRERVHVAGAPLSDSFTERGLATHLMASAPRLQIPNLKTTIAPYKIDNDKMMTTPIPHVRAP